MFPIYNSRKDKTATEVTKSQTMNRTENTSMKWHDSNTTKLRIDETTTLRVFKTTSPQRSEYITVTKY